MAHQTTSVEQVNKMIDSSKARVTGSVSEALNCGANTFEVNVAPGGDGIVTNKMMKKRGMCSYGGRMECACGRSIVASTKKEITFKMRLHLKVCPLEKK